jgi:hypothetical protein
MFSNRIRLPLYATTAQFPTEANRFRLADGSTKTQSVVIRKVYNLVTDYMGELMHQKLVIALNHDDVTIEGDRYIGGVTMEGEYAIEWPDFLDYPLGQGKTLINVTPFDATNSNCQTCDVLTQLALVDDDAGEIVEGGTGEVNVFANDEICCYPPVATIVYFNDGYLDSATIDDDGNVILTAKDPVSSVGSIIMATYRVTCPDGTYDEADVYASIAGSEPACEQPSDLEALNEIGTANTTVNWTNPAITPAGGFDWELYRQDTPGTPYLTGNTTDHFVAFTTLSGSTAYSFYVRSNCGGDVTSPYSQQDFTTNSVDTEDCGLYDIYADDGTLGVTVYFYSYMDCAGVIQNAGITNLAQQQVCMLMDPVTHEPQFFQEHAGAITYAYNSLC